LGKTLVSSCRERCSRPVRGGSSRSAVHARGVAVR
jgi:hypothetical protein